MGLKEISMLMKEYLARTIFHDRGKLASEFIGTYYIDSFSDFSSGLILKRFVC
jgi:hypothetical protein